MLGAVSCSSTPTPPPPVPGPETHAAATASSTAAKEPSVTGPARRKPPVPTRREEVVDELHGEKIVDPYRWLEDGESAEVKAWSASQNAYTESVLGALPGRDALKARIEQLLRIGSVGAPAVVGSKKGKGRYFHTFQSPAQDQPVLSVREGVDGKDRVLVDPNTMSKDGTTSLDFWVPSRDGKKLAYGLSSGGDEESTLYVMDTETGKNLPETEVIPRARYASVAWLPDGSGFYYSRYPEKGTVPAGEEHYHRKIFEHKLGRAWKEDPVVFGEGRGLTDSPSVDISPNGRWLVAEVHMGWSRREIYLLDRKGGAKAKWFALAVPKEDANYDVTAYDDFLLVRTNDGAPTYELWKVDPQKPARENWKKLLPARPDEVLVGATSIGGELFAIYEKDAHSRVERHAADGKLEGEFALPVLGTVGGVYGEHDGHEAFVSFTSFAVPGQIFRLDLKTGKTDVWAEVPAPVDPSQFVVTQEKARSKDGTMVPMFLVHKKGLVRDGTAPTLLSAYGGFNISQLPSFAGSKFALLERGGVLVVANLRGGGEYGEAWHRAGMLEKKQNVFDDFYAVAEHLITEKITSKEKLGIWGGSNGGLLIGAAITQRPELFHAAVCSVPLLDMLRYHKFLIAKLWIPEYGSADDPAQYRWLRAYSPYQHVEPGKVYPATLFATAEGDSRVDPLHARKMAALMQAEAGGDEPILLRIEGKAGHGAGKPISKRIEESVDIYSFLFWQLGVKMN
jgi:prolyl oligopeptidase